jgi:hypothetical protein
MSFELFRPQNVLHVINHSSTNQARGELMLRKYQVAVAIISAATLAFFASPASAAVTIVNPACSLVTGCKFNGNIQGTGTALETQTAYNAVHIPNILLNYLGKSDDPFGTVTGTTTGVWSLPGYIVDYIAVKSGPAFMLYSVTPGSMGTFTTAGLQNGENTDLPALSHLAFFGTVSAVPEPSTWAMMIGGFGLVGGAMRRRSRVKTTVSFI